MALFAIALVAFLVVKITPSHHKPPVEIQSAGSDRQLARRALAAELEKLFDSGNGRWQVIGAAGDAAALRCITQSKQYSTSLGHAITATYWFAGWLELRLASYVYASAAAAQRVLPALGVRHTEECRAMFFVDGLRREGYVVKDPYRLTSGNVNIGDGARSSHIEIPSQLNGRPYDWHLDSTAVLRGRMIVVAGTITIGSFAGGNQLMARDLAKAAGSAS